MKIASTTMMLMDIVFSSGVAHMSQRSRRKGETMSSCRWCAHMVYGDVPYCSIKEKVLAESTVRTYSCKLYEYCHIDAITLTERKERKVKRNDGKQEVMEDRQ